MSSIMPTHAYPMTFDHAAYWNMTMGSNSGWTTNYGDLARSPNTSGGSDGSSSSMTDPKNSPRYREKRAKNNEAAKKSRKQRKDREVAHQLENEQLKKKLAENSKANQNVIDQLQHMNVAVIELTAELDMYKQRCDVAERRASKAEQQNAELLAQLAAFNTSSKFGAHHNVLREVTNANIFPSAPKYENL